MKEKYSKIPEKTPTKESIFDSSSTSSANSSRAVSPIPKIPKKPDIKKRSIFTKFIILLLILLTLLMSYLLTECIQNLTVLVKGCEDDKKEFNLYCVDEDKFDKIKAFCQELSKEKNITNIKLEDDEIEYIEYCGVFKYNNSLYKLPSNRALVIAVIAGLLFTLLTTSLFLLKH